jgi:hypothetical protein
MTPITPTHDSRSYFSPFVQDLAPFCANKDTRIKSHTRLALLFWSVCARPRAPFMHTQKPGKRPVCAGDSADEISAASSGRNKIILLLSVICVVMLRIQQQQRVVYAFSSVSGHSGATTPLSLAAKRATSGGVVCDIVLFVRTDDHREHEREHEHGRDGTTKTTNERVSSACPR